MKEIIRRYKANGIEVRIAKYNENGKIQYHVEHDIKAVQDEEWFEEWNRTKAIMRAQFLLGWIKRNGYTKESINKF